MQRSVGKCVEGKGRFGAGHRSVGNGKGRWGGVKKCGGRCGGSVWGKSRDVNVLFCLCFFSKITWFKKTVFLQILLQAGILIVLCYFLAFDKNPISNGS